MIFKLLSLSIFISAIIAIYFRYRESPKMYAIFKPITTILIILLSIIIYQENQSIYSLIIIIGLFFSLIGDIFLIRDKYFLYGLSSFLLAHLAFTVAFSKLAGFNWDILPFAILLGIGGAYFIFLKNYLKKYTLPVAVYMLVIMFMNWQAIGLVLHGRSLYFLWIAGAALLFSFSDAIIAYKKFVKPFKSAEPLILSSYWVAIYIFTMVGLYIP